MTDTNTITVLEVDQLDLRQVFASEHRAFTPWLAQPDNIGRLSRSVGLQLEVIATEISTATFRTDILAEDMEDGFVVVIENQFGRSDHDHLGKALTYLSAHNAKRVIWLAERFADEHMAVLQWLNDNTPEEIGFYAVVPRLIRIGDSKPGLSFDVVARPNALVKAAREQASSINNEVRPTREAFWTQFNAIAKTRAHLGSAILRHGGGQGFIHIYPLPELSASIADPHVLAYVKVPASGQHAIGVAILADADREEVAEGVARAWQRAKAELKVKPNRFDTGTQQPADFTTEEGIQAAATTLADWVEACAANIIREFSGGLGPV